MIQVFPVRHKCRQRLAGTNRCKGEIFKIVKFFYTIVYIFLTLGRRGGNFSVTCQSPAMCWHHWLMMPSDTSTIL